MNSNSLNNFTAHGECYNLLSPGEQGKSPPPKTL